MKETYDKFTLKYSHVGSEEFSPMDITFEIPGGSTIDQMLFNFECFLKACGYIFDGSFVQSHPEEKYEGCMADWDDEEDDSPSFHDTLSTAICEDAKKKKSCCGLEETSSPCETSTWDEQFDITKTTHLGDSISPEEYQKQRLKNWNEGIAKLDKEVKKNKWFHGLCNPPSPDWKKSS